MFGNWTYEEYRRAVITAFHVEGKRAVSLDVSRADWKNMEHIKHWAAKDGYTAEEINSDCICISQREE